MICICLFLFNLVWSCENEQWKKAIAVAGIKTVSVFFYCDSDERLRNSEFHFSRQSTLQF